MAAEHASFAVLGWAEPPPASASSGASSPTTSTSDASSPSTSTSDTSPPSTSTSCTSTSDTSSPGGRVRAGPRLRLDWETFAYAGKFVLPETGKAIAHPASVSPPAVHAGDDVDPDDLPMATDVLAAAAFSPDRTDDRRLRVRYVTVHADHRERGLGARLLAFVASRAGERGYESVVIAVNNPFAHEAAAKAGYAFTGETTGIAELVCQRPAGGPPERVASAAYTAAIERFRERYDVGTPAPDGAAPGDAAGGDVGDPAADDDLGAERAFLASRDGTPPEPVSPD